MNNCITDVEGIKVGHYTDDTAYTGCTVIMYESGAVGGVDIRGGAPGTRETALLHPTCQVKKINSILITGGSALGLSAADGVVKFLGEKGYGFDAGIKKIPIVPSAVIFDFHLGKQDITPNAKDGYTACLNASTDQVIEGNVGAGTGAIVGKVCGIDRSMRGGLGTASIKYKNGLTIGALVVVNAFGDIRDYRNNMIIAGARSEDGGFINTTKYLMEGNSAYPGFIENTTIGVIATNADFDKAQVTKIAQMAHTGSAQVITPSQTIFDGDIIFTLSTGKHKADMNFVGIVAAELMKKAIINAVKKARTTGNVLSYSDTYRD